jgi:hypothetical protein
MLVGYVGQVSWLPVYTVLCAFPAFQQVAICTRQPVTVAGPRRLCKIILARLPYYPPAVTEAPYVLNLYWTVFVPSQGIPAGTSILVWMGDLCVLNGDPVTICPNEMANADGEHYPMRT